MSVTSDSVEGILASVSVAFIVPSCAAFADVT